MRILTAIFIFLSAVLCAQDKVFLKDGTVKQGLVLSMGAEYIFFKYSDTSSAAYKIPKTDVLMIEKFNGKTIIYGTKETKRDTALFLKHNTNSLGVQPFNLLLGRVTFIYERLNKTGKIGFCPALSLTFDPIGKIYRASSTSNTVSLVHNEGLNFIGGADVNFYVGKYENATFFIGPRIRYGVDMFMRSLEAYTVQTQVGWRFTKPGSKFSQHLSLGFGFIRILSFQGLNGISPKQSYGWGSVNYRIGINW